MADASAGGVVRLGSGRGQQEQGKSKRTGPVRCRVFGSVRAAAVACTGWAESARGIAMRWFGGCVG